MGFTDSIKSAAAKIATQARETHVSVKITSGKNFLNLGAFSDTATIRQNSEGQIYFDKVDGFFEIIDYQWDGPKYKTVSTSNTKESSKGKDKTKHKGGLGGAVIGTVLMPGVGTAVGYALTRKKQVDKKGQSESNTVESTSEEEIQTNAKLTFRNISTGESFVIGFLCDTAVDGELANFNMNTTRTVTSEEVDQQKDKVSLMKEYKELLDAGIISQEEFYQKKKEILGL